MKKILSMMLTATMAMSMPVGAFAADFNDIANVPQAEAIDVVETLNIVSGYPDGSFLPDNILTRAELCTIMTKALYGNPIYASTNHFKDVPTTHWANAYINTAYAYDLMAGYPDNMFGPEDKITYTQLATVIMKELGYDIDKMSWPTGVNAMAHNLGLFDNVYFTSYEKGCTRANAAQMIYNAFDIPYVNHKTDYPIEIQNTSFLSTGLGFEKVEGGEYVDGHIYVAYKDLNDEDADYLITDIRSTVEKVIYPASANSYVFETMKKPVSIDWMKVDLYVNGESVDIENVSTWFVADYDMIGTFNDKNELIAIYVKNPGKTFIPYIDETGMPEEIKNDEDYDERTSTVTYFIEDDTYIISNKIVSGFITNLSSKSIWIDDVKYPVKNIENYKTNDYNENDFVVLYFNYRDEIVGIKKIEDPYYFNTKTMKYHTWECFHYNDRANETNWSHGIDNVKINLSVTNKAGTTVRFDACKDCHGDGKRMIKIPITTP